MKRKPVRWTVSALVAAVVVVLVTLWLLPTRYETDSVTVQDRPAMGETGPAPGTFRLTWQRSFSTGSPAHDQARSLNPAGGGHILTVQGNRLQAFDAHTGKKSWHYRQPGRTLGDVVSTDGGVIVRFRESGDTFDSDSIQLVGLDPRTGEVLWIKNEDWSSHNVRPGTSDPAAGVIPFEDGYDRVVGIEAATGDIAWEVTSDQLADLDCGRDAGTAPEDAESEPLVIVELTCRQGSVSGPGDETVAAVGADSGEIFWTAVAGRSSDFFTAGGMTLTVEQGSRTVLRVIDQRGEPVYEDEAESTTTFSLLRAGNGDAVLTYDDSSETARLRVVRLDPGSGKTSKSTLDAGLPTSQPVVAGDRLYVPVRRDLSGTGDMMPLDGLVVLDLESGKSSVSPLPTFGPALRSRLDRGAAMANPVLLDAAGERLLISRVQAVDPEGTTRTAVFSYEQVSTDQPSELGGVHPDAWPRTCDVLEKATSKLVNRTTEDDEPSFDPSRQPVNGFEIAQRFCAAHLPGVGQIDLTVHWVTATTAEAKELLPKAVETDGTRVTRIGRVIIEVTSATNSQDTDDLVARIRDQLPRALVAD